jgi:molybdenum cofactor cytidylyltransferase
MTWRPVVVVLAAGHGVRYGADRHKLEQLVDGLPVLSHTLRNALASQLDVVVVTNESLAELARRSVAARDLVVVDTAAPFGMGYSIAAGVAARAQASGWLILPGDMPLVRPGTLTAVARALAQHPIVYAQYRGQRGHPVGFGAELYTELVMLTGDEGARRLLARYPSHAVNVDDPGVLIDIDTPEDLSALETPSDSASGASPGAPASG